MRIIHTADWHLGHVLYGHDRSADHRIALACLANYVAEYQPDALVVSGDIFHTSQPSTAAMQLLSECLIDLRTKAPNMHIVLTAGNHDSPSRHEVFRLPWQALNVTVVGRPPFDETDIERFIIPVCGKGIIVGLPYIHPRHVPRGFFENLYALIDAQNSENLPVITMAHAAVTGCDTTGHDDWNADVIGSLDTINASDLGAGYDYLALGHIHHAQTLKDGCEAVRYAGSLCPVSFAERYEHSVTLVEIDGHNETPRLKPLPLETGHSLITFGDDNGLTPEQVTEGLKEQLDSIQTGDYLRVNVSLESTQALPATMTQAVAHACEQKGIKLCGYNVLRKSVLHAAVTGSLSSDELQRLAPIELLKIYASQRSLELDNDMEDLFNRIAQKEMDATSHED